MVQRDHLFRTQTVRGGGTTQMDRQWHASDSPTIAARRAISSRQCLGGNDIKSSNGMIDTGPSLSQPTLSLSKLYVAHRVSCDFVVGASLSEPHTISQTVIVSVCPSYVHIPYYIYARSNLTQMWNISLVQSSRVLPVSHFSSLARNAISVIIKGYHG